MSYDGDSTDLTNSKILDPNYGGTQTLTGHTDSYSDWDYGSLYVTTTGYYDVSSTGNTEAYVFDATAGSFVYGSNYQDNLYLDSSHTNYVYVTGYTGGTSYSVSVKPT